MKKFTLFALLMLLLAINLPSCKKSEPNKSEFDCIEQFVQINNFVPYAGQVFLDCTDMVLLFEYDGKDYFIEDNNCADMIAIPFDRDCLPLCQSVEDPILNEFFRTAVYQKIMWFKP